MAQRANSPMRVTTADTFPITLFAHWCQIHHFEFLNTAAADTCVVKDLLGNIVWQPVTPTDVEPVISEPIGDVYGLSVFSFTSATGELLVFFN